MYSIKYKKYYYLFCIVGQKKLVISPKPHHFAISIEPMYFCNKIQGS